MIFSTILRFFGYAKVPPEAVQLACAARMTWERTPTNPAVGEALKALEGLMRSTQ